MPNSLSVVATPRVETLQQLSGEQAAAVLRLRDEVAAVDGFSSLSDPVVGAIRHGQPGIHLLQRDDDGVAGYAYVEPSGSHPIAELVVGATGDPNELLTAIVEACGPGVRIWTKGDGAPLNGVLPTLGFTLRRTLVKLHRLLAEPPLPEPVWPSGVTVRTFTVGSDEAAWLAVNNAAFAGHPEQSGWTLADIQTRESEPWFDPAGFFLAEVDGELAGFHWTKRHSPAAAEVYVIGVAPQAQGKRLGEALLLHGLRHLRDAGAERVFLYVEATNAPAIALYERLGFAKWNADRLYELTSGETSEPSSPATTAWAPAR